MRQTPAELAILAQSECALGDKKLVQGNALPNDHDSGFEDAEKVEFGTGQNCPEMNIQPVIDPNQLYQLQLQQYHAWMYYQQQNDISYNNQASVS